MISKIPVMIDVNTTVDLIFRARVDVDDSGIGANSEEILRAISNMPVDQLLSIVDSVPSRNRFLPKDIPQFGKVDTLVDVPIVFFQTGLSKLNYAQLGVSLSNNPDISIPAATKYGENHGKAVSMLGLLDLEDNAFHLSKLGKSFNGLNKNEQHEVTVKLFMRVPLIQELLKRAKNSKVNGYDLMNELTDSTKKRRGSNVKGVLNAFQAYGNSDMNSRIKNIYWSI